MRLREDVHYSPMIKRTQLLPTRSQSSSLAARFALSVCLILISTSVAAAIPASEYHQHIQEAITALNTVSRSEATETATAYGVRDAETVEEVRKLLPSSETVEWEGGNVKVNNAWLHHELSSYVSDNTNNRYDLLKRIIESLQALDERVKELEKPPALAVSKAEENRKLQEILQRPEYARKVKAENPFTKQIDRFIKWIMSWFPKPKPISATGAGLISAIAKWVVIVLALGVLAFALKLVLQRLLRHDRPKRKDKAKARIVLGEHLEPDQSAFDLLSEAEGLARRGELRAAIRRAYIALLVELGDRKIISLAQHKTNRDYLRSVREVEPLYGNVKQLTDSFERHWYGLAQATETDWQAFRSAYHQTLR